MRLVLVHMGTDEQAEELFARYGLADALRLADPDRTLYREFALTRARVGQWLAPAARATGPWARATGRRSSLTVLERVTDRHPACHQRWSQAES